MRHIMIKLNELIPNFTAIDDQGNEFSLEQFRGKKIILYFYPKDDTPGCTIQAKDFRDALEQFAAKNTVILGISKDDTKSHQKFKQKFCLPFTLLTDNDGSICELFGTWIQKSMFGKKYMGIDRATFIIDETGKLIKEWRKVSASGHVKEVLAVL